MFGQSIETVADLLKIWNAIELFTPPKHEKFQNYLDMAYKIHKDGLDFISLTEGNSHLFLLNKAPCLFDENKLKFIRNEEIKNEKKEEKKTFWQAYVGYLNWTKTEDFLEKAFKPDFNFNLKDKSKKTTVCPLAGFTMDSSGVLFLNSLVISSGAWVLGKVLKYGMDDCLNHLLKFQEEVEAIKRGIQIKLYSQDSNALNLNHAKIKIIFDYLIETLHIDRCYLLEGPDICISKTESRSFRKSPLKNTFVEDKANSENDTAEEPQKEEEPDKSFPPLEMLNSFFLDEIELIQKKLDALHPRSALAKYLGMTPPPFSQDIMKDFSLLANLLDPQVMAASRWPSAPERALSALQGASLTAIFKETDSEGRLLFAINGPPGTGKTTLLSDLIANIYVKRARQLTRMKSPKEGFLPSLQQLVTPNFTYHYRAIHPNLAGYEILTASSNNNAVENISNQLPLMTAIDRQYHSDIHFLECIANNSALDPVLAKRWGLFTAILGNKNNRCSFSQCFWQSKPLENKGKKHPTFYQYLSQLKGKLKEFYPELMSAIPEYCKSDESIQRYWEEECKNFQDLWQEVEEIRFAIAEFQNFSAEKVNIISKSGYLHPKLALEKQLEELDDLKIRIEIRKIEIEETSKFLKKINIRFFKFFHKLFNTTKYRIYNSQFLKKSEEYQLLLIEQGKAFEVRHSLRSSIEKLKIITDEIDKIENNLKFRGKFLENQGFNLSELVAVNKSQAEFSQEMLNDFHLKVPCFSPHFEKMRSQLFIKALNLHEIFIHANSQQFWNGLKLFMDLLNGSIKKSQVTPQIVQTAWQTFFLVIPVISTTFHSIGSLLQGLDHEMLGWLIIDEAGQSAPQHAVGAIFRSKKVVIVGDPLQTKPISILGEKLIERLFQKYSLNFDDWSGGKVSVQSLADRNSSYQTRYGKDILVGFPLIVHRRCQEPMFSICNHIAYENKMIHAVGPHSSPLTKILGPSRWIDAIDEKAVSADYSSEVEVQYLKWMLEYVFKKENGDNLLSQIYVITFYKKYSNYIKEELKKHFFGSTVFERIKRFCRTHVGTIYAFQGKENDTVILLLGAQQSYYEEARKVMVKAPNILNVGITRAKNHLYVIGNKRLWKEHSYMQIVDDYLQAANSEFS